MTVSYWVMIAGLIDVVFFIVIGLLARKVGRALRDRRLAGISLVGKMRLIVSFRANHASSAIAEARRRFALFVLAIAAHLLTKVALWFIIWEAVFEFVGDR